MSMTDAELLASIPEAAPETKTETTEDATHEEVITKDGTENETVALAAGSDEDIAGDSADTQQDSDKADSQTYTVKVNGEDMQVSLEDLQKGYSTNQAAQQKFNDASLQRKQAEEFINLLKTNPMQVLQAPELGIDMRAISEQYLADQLNFEQLTDEQRELIMAKQQLAQFEQDKVTRAQTEHDANVAQLAEQYNVEYTERINTALTEATLPVTEDTIRRMASYMSEALGSEDAAIRNLSDKDIVELVREDYVRDIKTMLGESNAETLTNMLGSDISTTLRKADIAQLKGKPPVTKQPAKGNHTPVTDETRMGTEQWNDFLDNYK